MSLQADERGLHGSREGRSPELLRAPQSADRARRGLRKGRRSFFDATPALFASTQKNYDGKEVEGKVIGRLIKDVLVQKYIYSFTIW